MRPQERGAPGADLDQPAIEVDNLELHGNRGRVYGPCTFTVPVGRLTVLRGSSGSGRTALLLTLTGRMRPSRGSAAILGESYPKQGRRIRRDTAIAGFAGIDDLDEATTVGEAVRERDCWLAPWYKRVPRTTAERVEQVCGPIFGDRPHPAPSTLVWELGELDTLLLQVALALLPQPLILAVDDADQVSDPADRRFLLHRLHEVATATTVIVAAVDEGPPLPGAHYLDPHEARLGNPHEDFAPDVESAPYRPESRA